jgi:two-component system, cell cycle sensor histidine kinase and response regulator CckA
MTTLTNNVSQAVCRDSDTHARLRVALANAAELAARLCGARSALAAILDEDETVLASVFGPPVAPSRADLDEGVRRILSGTPPADCAEFRAVKCEGEVWRAFGAAPSAAAFFADPESSARGLVCVFGVRGGPKGAAAESLRALAVQTGASLGLVSRAARLSLENSRLESERAGLVAELGELRARGRQFADAAERAHEKLCASEERLRLICDEANDIIFTLDLEGRYTYLNSAAEMVGGYGRGELLGRHFTELVVPEQARLVRERFSRKLAGLEENSCYEVDYVARDGRRIALEINSLPFREGGRVAGVLGIARDVTERRLADTALRESEEHYRLLFDHNPHPMWVYDVETLGFVAVNSSAVRHYGYTREEFLSMTLADIRPSGEVAGLMMRLRESEGRDHVSRPSVHRKRDGEVIHVDITSHEMPVEGRRCRVVLAHDVTQRVRAEEALRESEERLRAQYRGLPVPTYTWRREGDDLVLRDFNDAAGVLTHGRAAALVGRRASEIYAERPDILEDFRRCSEGREVVSRETLYRMASTGEEKYLRIAYAFVPPDVVMAHVEDITERRALEEQFRQAQKLESVGRLAGGVAHDFNNLLTAINGYADLLLRSPSVEGAQRGRVSEIRRAGERAAGLTRQLLAFSRKQVLQPKLLDLNLIVSDTETMLRRMIGEDVQLHTNLAPGLHAVRADPGQVEQVLMNLAVNARDAMPGGGHLTIETRNVSLDEAYAGRHVAVRPGDYVMMAVSDNGVGMDEATRRQIFEPFFTTKEAGKGTGLGLSTVYGIVKQSGGNVWVYSEVGEGTTFKIYLPRDGQEAAAERGGGQAPEALPSGDETVLLVEDDETVREMTKEALELSGFVVVAAGHGEEALRVCREHRGPIDILLTDVVMPQMGGRTLVERLAEAGRRDLPVIFMSGYTDDAVVRHGILREDVNFIQKPFTPDVLVRKIRAVLDGREK